MKKFSRKNYSGLSHFASKAGIGSSSSAAAAAAAAAPPPSSSPATQAPTNSSSSSSSGGGILKRPTWADKVRDKLPELGENEYEVLWERGVLGVIFLESEKNGIPYVSKATESCISPLVHAGDVLKYVNVVCSHDHSFSEFFKILATMKKPVLLRFERPASSTTSSDGEDSPLDQRSSSAAGIGDHAAMSNGLKVLRSNSVPQPEPQPKTGRSAFWRTVSAKEPPPPVVVPPPVVHANEYVPAVPAHTGSSGAYAPVKLQPPVPSRGGDISDRYRQMETARPYDVSPRDVYSEYVPPHETEFYEYEVYWETGSLGLFFGEDRTTNLPVVTRSTPNANSVVQRMVAVNDTLVSANHVQSRDFTFEAFFARLQQMTKPVRLVFRRKVDAATVPVPARARKASVTVDSLTSPGDPAARRLPTPPRHLPSVEEQAPREQAARTPPASPVYARESVRESRRDGSARSRKPELDIDTCVSPPLAPRESPSAPLATSALEQPHTTKRTGASPLNLAGASAAIMRSGSDSSSSPSSSRELDEPDLIPLETPVMTQSSAPVASPHATPPPHSHSSTTTATQRSVSPTSSLSQSYVQSKSNSMDTVSRQSAPTISLDTDAPPSRSLALSSPLPVTAAAVASSSLATREEIASWMSDSSDDEDHGDSELLDDTHTHALLSQSSSISASGVMTFSPPPSPKRSSIQRLDDLDLEAKPAAAVVVVEPSSPRQERSLSSPTKPQPSRTSGESRSLWEEAAEAPALSNDSSPRLSDEDDDVEDEVEAPAADADASSVDHDFAYPVDAAFDDAVVAAPVVDDVVAVGVELGIVADVAIGIAVDADVVSAASLYPQQHQQTEDVDGVAEPALAVVTVAPVASEMLAVAAEAVTLDDSQAAAAALVAAVDIDMDDRIALPDDTEQRSSDLQSELESTARTGLVDDDSDVLDAIDQDITAEIDGNDLMPPIAKLKSSSSSVLSSSSSSSSTSLSPFKANKAVVHANLAKYKRKAKNSRAVTKLPALTEDSALTVPLVAPNAVNTTIQVRGRSKPKPSMLETPDSTTYLVKWKESRSIGLQLKEVRLAKGVFPLVTDVCQEPCCELLKHVCIGDVIVEINGRNTSLMGVKKTVSFLKSCSKTTLLKLRHGPGFVPQRVSAHV